MFAKDYPNTVGVYDVGLSDTLAYPDESQSDFIQKLKVAGTHWVYLTNKHCKPATAKTHYDHSKLRPHYLQCLQDKRMTPFHFNKSVV